MTSTTGTGGNGGGGQAGASGSGGATGMGGGTAGTTTGTGGAATGTGGATTGTGGTTTGTGGTTTGTGGATTGTGGTTTGTGGTGTGTGGASTGGASGVGGSSGASGAAGSTATGGASGAAGGAGTGGGSGDCGNLIDNMESGDGYICTGNGRMGYWYTYIDTTSGSSITPPSTMKPILPSATSPTRAGSNWAMHASGTFHSYAGMGCILDATIAGSRQSFNASAFTGVHFWAHGSAGIKLVLQASGDELTSNGGTCTTTCYGSDFALAGLSSTAWTEYTVPFSSVTGGTVPLLPSDLWSVEFGPVTPGAFDMWIDDLSFY